MQKTLLSKLVSSFLNYSLDLKKVATYIAGGEDAEDDDDDDAEAEDEEAEDGMNLFFRPLFRYVQSFLIENCIISGFVLCFR